MSKCRFMISDAAKEVDVEAHVLRYWEEELGLDIARNEMGHRYYSEEDIIRFREIRDLKEKGYQLKAIRMFFLNQETETAVKSELTAKSEEPEKNEAVVSASNTILGDEQRRNQAKLVFRELMAELLQENTNMLITAMNEKVGDRILKQVDYLFREQDEKDEERYQKIDRLIRGKQAERKQRHGKLKSYFAVGK